MMFLKIAMWSTLSQLHPFLVRDRSTDSNILVKSLLLLRGKLIMLAAL